MSVEINVMERNEGQKDFFKTGNYVISKNKKWLVLVDSSPITHNEYNQNEFAGSVIRRKGEPERYGDYDLEEGDFIARWLKKEFEQFRGKITIEVNL